MSRVINTFRCHPNDEDSSAASAFGFDQAGKALLAVASATGGVSLYDYASKRYLALSSTDLSGRAIPAVEVPTRTDASCIVTTITWKPRELVWAMGTESGQISLWEVSKKNEPMGSTLQVKCLCTNTTAHSSAVKCLEWERNGSMLVTGDKIGQVVVFEIIADDKLIAKSWQKKEAPVANVAWCCFDDEEMSYMALIVFGLEDGLICIMSANGGGGCTDVHNFRSSVERIIFYEAKRRVVIFTQSLEMAQYHVMADGTLSLRSRQKLSIPGQQSLSLAWIERGLAVCASGEHFLRFYNLNDDETSVLQLLTQSDTASSKATLVSYNNEHGKLVAATEDGIVMMWKCNNDNWDLHFAQHTSKQKPLKVITSSSSRGWISAINCDDGVYVLREESLAYCYNEGTAAIQVAQHSIVLDHSSGNPLLRVNAQIAANGIVCDARHLVIWNGIEIHVCRIFDSPSRVELFSELQLESNAVSLRSDNLYILSGKKLLVTSLMGVQRVSVLFPDVEGRPILLSVNQNILAVVTTLGVLKIFDISKTEPNLIRNPATLPLGVGEIISIKCNATGSLLSLLSESDGCTRIHLYFVDRKELKPISFEGGGYPLSHVWEPADPKLLACEVNYERLTSRIDARDEDGETKDLPRVLLFFVDDDGGGVYVYEKVVVQDPSSVLIGIDVPHIVFAQNTGSQIVLNKVMRDFIGLEDESALVMAAMIEFSFHILQGKIDRAFEAIGTIKSANVWENLAPICINMKRLDLTEICLSKMGHVNGMAAVRRAKASECGVEVALAAAAVQLGLFDIAETLYAESNQHASLNLLYQGQNRWEKAITIAEDRDRLHLDLTRQRFAQHLEAIGELSMAEDRFGKFFKGAKTPKLRQVLQRGHDAFCSAEVENYITQKNDRDLYQFYGLYCEHVGATDKANDYYLLANDDLSLVKLACNSGDFDKAKAIVEESGCASGAYYLAKFSSGPDAVRLYSRGGFFNKAIRTAMSHDDCDDELLEIASKCKEPQLHDIAKYFERKGIVEHACSLYMRCGQNKKAMQMCLEALDRKPQDQEMNELLVFLTNKLNENATMEYSQRIVEIASKCEEQGNHHLACKMLTLAGRRIEAMKVLCRGGHTKAVVSYANLSKQTEIYTLAGNYLAKLDSSNDPKIKKSIVNFYTKAKKHDKLVNFFISEARCQSLNNGQYEKAIEEYREAMSHSAKINSAAKDEIQSLIKKRLEKLEQFLQARNSLSSMDKASLRKLLDDLEGDIREGDSYALLVEFAMLMECSEEAYELISMMEKKNIDPHQYIDAKVFKFLGIKDILNGEKDGKDIEESFFGSK